MHLPTDPSLPLEATIAGVRFACRDDDVLGREGTVGADAARQVPALSRRHLLVRWRGGAWQIILLPTARNQTLLDGDALARETPRTLALGEHTVSVQGQIIYLHVGTGVEADVSAVAVAGHAALARLREELGPEGSLLGLVADHVADLLAVVDQHGRRVWNNAAYFSCLGYPPREISDSDSMAEIHPDDLPTVQRVFEETMRSLVGQRLEYRMRHRDGHWVFLESQARVVATAGGGKYLVLVARDITERQRAEAQERTRFQRRADRALALAEFGRARSFQDGDIPACFAAVTEAAVRLLDGARAGVWLFSGDGTTLACHDEYTPGGGHAPGPAVPTRPAGEIGGIYERLRTERCVVAQGSSGTAGPDGLGADWLVTHAAAGWLAARIGLGDEVLGALALEHAAESDVGWSQEDQAFAASLADALLLCLHARRRAEAFAALQESQRQVAADLAGAAGYVRALLPPPLTGGGPGGVESDWRLVPCTTLGGDGLGHRWLDADHLAIYLIDSVGHGVSAALLAISVLNVLRSGSLPATDFRDPAQVLAGLNRGFQMETQNNMFFTAWYGVYHRPTRRLTCAAAAHPAAVLLGAEGTGPVSLGGEGLMIGVDVAASYPNMSAEVPVDGRLYVFSDGVFEVLGPDGKAWSYDAFVACLGRTAGDGKPELDALRETVQQVQGQPDLPDDFSILRLTFH